MGNSKRRIRPWVRWAAAFLALAFVFTFSAQSWITVKIAADDANAARDYLARQTGYVNAGSLERLRTKLQTLVQPDGLEDYYRLAETAIAAEEYEEALGSIEQCLALYQPEFGDTLKTELLLKQGCLLTILGSGAEAAPVMEQVIALAPALADAYLVLAQIYAEAGDAPAACGALEGYLEQQPDAADLRLLLAQLYLAQGQTELAAGQAEILTARGGADEADLAGLLGEIGLARLEAQDQAGALENFRAALALDAEAGPLSYYAGLCCLVLEQYDEAVEHYTRAIDQQTMPQLSRYGRGAAELMRAEPDLETAREDLTFAARYDGEDEDPTITRQAQDLLELIEQ